LSFFPLFSKNWSFSGAILVFWQIFWQIDLFLQQPRKNVFFQEFRNTLGGERGSKVVKMVWVCSNSSLFLITIIYSILAKSSNDYFYL
jgi:hypothetical protein